MTKRAFQKFPREVDDFYPTPEEAIEPLLPHLLKENGSHYAEPCFGDGSLAQHLEKHGYCCIAMGDLNFSLDARAWGSKDYNSAKFVVTNPPWEARLMMEIMQHQSQFLPSWFLIYSDWLFTHQSHELMRDRCSDIVPIGRLKWIRGSKSVGFDNCCWVRMWKGKVWAPARFWPMLP